MSVVRTYLEQLKQIMGDYSIATFLLDHGKEYESKALPEGFEYMTAKECYANVFSEITNRKLLGDLSYVYCEGYAYTPGLIPCDHAWILDKTDGKVIDVTWRDGGRQCGFCCGDGEVPDEDDNLETCWWCKGKGEQEHDHPKREGTEYFGIEFDIQYVIRTTVAQGYYGIIESYAQEIPEFRKETSNV